jgi:hypothetical protein
LNLKETPNQRLIMLPTYFLAALQIVYLAVALQGRWRRSSRMRRHLFSSLNVTADLFITYFHSFTRQ